MKLRKFVAIFVGLLCIGGSIFTFIFFTKHYEKSMTTMVTLQPARMIEAGEIITPELIQLVEMPILAHKSDALIRQEDLVNKRAIMPIGVGEEFLAWKVAEDWVIPNANQRYVSFPTDAGANVTNMVRRGDHVAIWVEFSEPKLLVDDGGSQEQVGSIKILDHLLVAHVKNTDGQEVVDGTVGDVLNPLRTAANRLDQLRSKPSSQAAWNTFVMREEEIHAYELGALGGKIKLTLPNLSNVDFIPSGVTEMFQQLQTTEIFHKESKVSTVHVRRLVRSEIGN